MDKVILNYDSRKKCLEKIEKIDHEPEMSEFESAFLSGLLYKYKPKKIVEVGIAAGGTTAIILQTLDEMQSIDKFYDYELYSVDLSETYYRDGVRPCGFLGDRMAQITGTKCYKKLIGKVLPERLDEIGKGIDFVILDTVHAVPGEIMDFLAILPYLSENAVICLHDLTYHYNNLSTEHCCSNSILFNTVAGNRIIDIEHKQSMDAVEYPNIGAFQITEDTKKYVDGLFCSLTLNWYYMPESLQLNVYRKHYSRFYSSTMLKIFDNAIVLAERNVVKKRDPVKFSVSKIGDLLKSNSKDIVFWGAGNICKSVLLEEKILPNFIVDSSDNKIGNILFGFEIYKATHEFIKDKYIIITCKDKESIITQLKEWGVSEDSFISISELYD